MLEFFNKGSKQINTFFFKTEKIKLLKRTKKNVLLNTPLFKKNLNSNNTFVKDPMKRVVFLSQKKLFLKPKNVYGISFKKKKNKAVFSSSIIYIKHFLNLFILCGKRFYVDASYKQLIVLHKQQNSTIIQSIYKLIYLLQFSLLLKGYRYKVGRGVIKYRYFLTPLSILRQIFLSFFYFKMGLKKQKHGIYLNKLLIEFYRLMYFEENNAVIIINNLYDLAYQSRMFTPKPKKKKRVIKKKIKNPIIAYYYKNHQQKAVFSRALKLVLTTDRKKKKFFFNKA